MENGRPVWQHQCELCCACLHFCPVEAIQLGMMQGTKGRGRYRHPDLKIDDMKAQRGKSSPASADSGRIRNMTMTETSEKPASSRQNIRKWILIISFLLLPVTLVYISPIIILMGAAEGIATGSMLLFIALFFLSLVVARLWCGWFCPMGAWQEICSPVMKHTVQDGLAELRQVWRYRSLACAAGVPVHRCGRDPHDRSLLRYGERPLGNIVAGAYCPGGHLPDPLHQLRISRAGAASATSSARWPA